MLMLPIETPAFIDNLINVIEWENLNGKIEKDQESTKW